MTKLKQLIGEGRAIFALALCLLTCGLLAPSSRAEGKTYGIDAEGYVCRYKAVDKAPGNSHGGWYSLYVMKQADAKAAMGTTATVTYQTMATWLGENFKANKASVIANAEKIPFCEWDEEQYNFEKDGGDGASLGNAIGVYFFADESGNRAYNVMSNDDDECFDFDDYFSNCSGWKTAPSEELPTEPIPSSVTAPEHATAAVYTNKVVDAQYESTDGTVWSNRIAKVVYTVDSDKDWYFKGGTWVKAITNELDTTVNPAVDTNTLPTIIEVTCTRTTVTTDDSPYVLEEGKTYTTAPTTKDGGVFYLHTGATLTGTNVTFAGNEAMNGGAICTDGGRLSLEGGTFESNKVEKLGGAIYNGGKAALKGTAFTGNKATQNGGAIYNAGTLSLDGVSFAGNEAGDYGGAIANGKAKTVNFEGPVTLKTASDTVYNKGTLNWNLADGKRGLLNGYQNLINDGSTAKLQLTVGNYPAMPTNFVIATGDFKDIKGKNTFKVRNGEATATIAVGGDAICLGGTWWSLAIEDADKLVLKTVETVTLSNVTIAGATPTVTSGGMTVAPNVDSTYAVPKGFAVMVTYTATDDYMLDNFGAKTKTVTLDPLTGDYAMTDDDKPTAEALWADVREIAIDTRERIVVKMPEEVLPIAYSTNHWGQAPSGQEVTITSRRESDPVVTVVDKVHGNGYAEWLPELAAYGEYRIATNNKLGIGGTFAAEVYLYYGAPYAVTWEQPEGGTIVVEVEGEDIASGDEVIAYSSVKTIAEPADATWQLKSFSAKTNGVALELDEAATAITNRFEMPFGSTVFTAEFVVSDAYVEAATNELTTAYEDDVAYLETILEEPELSKALADVKKTYDDGLAAIRTATTPATVDAAKAQALEDVRKATDRHSKFPIEFRAQGGKHANGLEIVTNDCYVGKGYELPSVARKGYAFNSWCLNWKDTKTAVTNGQKLAALAAHSLYAVWTSTAPTPMGGELVLPDLTADGQPNTTIAAGAYNKDTSLKSVTTPLYLKSIGEYAFNGCTSLEALTITAARDYDTLEPQPVTIARNAFSGCRSLKCLYIDAEIETLGASTFQDCAALRRIVFGGDNAMSFGKSAFRRCGYANGDGKISVYMSQAFKVANTAFVSALGSWFTESGVEIVEKVDVTPATGVDGINVDFSQLGPDRRLGVMVKTDAAGMPDVDGVDVEYKPTLSSPAWQVLPAQAKTPFADGSVLVEVTVPDGDSGFLRAVVK